MKTSELKKHKEIEAATFEEDGTEQLPPIDIVAYNELRSCADILRMYKQQSLNINPEFQRDFIWTDIEQTRFIDSLTKQLPIPSLCFSFDYKSEKWQVIDGLQRISTIIKFLTDDKWKLSKLDDINKDLSEHVVKEIRNSIHLMKYYKRVENVTLPITVLRCDYSKPSHQKYLFTIFHRLNSGGKKLNNQEIRNCIYSGKLNDLLKELNNNKNWIKLNKIKQNKSNRFITHEVILRFFAFYDNLNIYEGKLTDFLNNYMEKYQNPDDNYLDQKRIVFTKTVDIIHKKIFNDKLERKISNTVMEALLYGVAKNIDTLEKKTVSELNTKYRSFRNLKVLTQEFLYSGLAKKEKVQDRLEAAENIFSDKN